MKKDDHWTANHITYDGDWYTAWDETGADSIGFYLTYEEAKKALIDYSRTLNGKMGTSN